MSVLDLDNVFLYRMTHIDNMTHILECGITHRNSPDSNPNFINIGDTSLISTRSRKVVSVDNGDPTSPNARTITLGDFIPFYFGVRMPMLYVIQNGGNFVEKATPASEIVYMACKLVPIVESGKECYFSDGHAIDNLTSFYDGSCLNELPAIIDWNAVKAPYWSGVENLNIRRKKQAEFLIMGDLSAKYITRFGCYNDPAKQRLIKMGIDESAIKVIPQAYY